MAQYIKISSVGSEHPGPDKIKQPESAAELISDYWDKKIAQVLADEPDIIVLPELCDLTASDILFPERFNYDERLRTRLFSFFSQKAKQNNCYLVYPTIRELEDKSRRNSAILFNKEGSVEGIYDKNYPTIKEMQNYRVLPGRGAKVVEADIGSIGFTVCFDLNFDQLRQEYISLKPDLIIFPSMFHGGILQNYWAYSCRSFFVSSIGTSAIPSQIRDPHGNIVSSSTNYSDFVTATVNTDCALVHLDNNRRKLIKLKETYRGDVRISDPGRFGSVLVYSESENVTADQLLAESGIESLNEYLQRSSEYLNGKTQYE